MTALGSTYLSLVGISLRTTKCIQFIDSKIPDLFNEVKSFSICLGVTRIDNAKNKIMHVIPKTFDPLMEEYMPYPRKETWRSMQCEILTHEAQQCKSCQSADNESPVTRSMAPRRRKVLLPAKTKAPVATTNPARIKLTLQALKCARLQKELMI